jgi:hypothetical protein
MILYIYIYIYIYIYKQLTFMYLYIYLIGIRDLSLEATGSEIIEVLKRMVLVFSLQSTWAQSFAACIHAVG